MKRRIIICLLTAVCGGLQAQTKDSIDVSQFVVTYDYAVKTMMGRNDSAFVDSCQIELLVGKSHTMQMERNRYAFRLLGDRSVRGEMIRNSVHSFPVIWTNSDRLTTVREFLPPHIYRMEEPTEAQRWTLTDDTLTVSGYACKKASCEYGGRKWTVWYTEEIPSTAGPWKLHGLPGLIVKATDAEGIHTFCLSSLEQKAVTMPLLSQPTDIVIKCSKFVKQRNKLLCDRRYAKNPSYFLPADVNTTELQYGGEFFSFLFDEDGHGGIHVNTTKCIPSANNVRYYQPLELK